MAWPTTPVASSRPQGIRRGPGVVGGFRSFVPFVAASGGTGGKVKVKVGGVFVSTG